MALWFILLYSNYASYGNILPSGYTLLGNTIPSSTKPFPQSRQGCLLLQDTPRQSQQWAPFSWNYETLLRFDKNKSREKLNEFSSSSRGKICVHERGVGVKFQVCNVEANCNQQLTSHMFGEEAFNCFPSFMGEGASWCISPMHSGRRGFPCVVWQGGLKQALCHWIPVLGELAILFGFCELKRVGRFLP